MAKDFVSHTLGMSSARRILLGLCCGALAIDVNSAMLATIDALGVRTAHGGLLQLLNGLVVHLTGPGAWSGAWIRATSGPAFRLAFHIGVGLAMAVFYVTVVRYWPPRGRWRNVIAYALGVWLLNAGIVLPLIGEGFAGSHTLTPAGMVGFAIAHTTFFVMVAGLFAFLSREVVSDDARP